jgi:hypothetical protein
MKKFLILSLAAVLFFSCAKKDPAIIEEETRPLQLTESEVELWTRLMIVDFKKPGIYHAGRAALNADKVIIELRKRIKK